MPQGDEAVIYKHSAPHPHTRAMPRAVTELSTKNTTMPEYAMEVEFTILLGICWYYDIEMWFTILFCICWYYIKQFIDITNSLNDLIVRKHQHAQPAPIRPLRLHPVDFAI